MGGFWESNSLDSEITIDVPKDRTWNTNSDSLCNYMLTLDYLKKKIVSQAIYPRYVKEQVEYLGIPGLKRIALPMICFCDIPFSKIRVHIAKYGGYGLAFDKTKITGKYSLQPIHYISENSQLKKDFNEAYRRCMDIEDDMPQYRPLEDYLLSSLAYMKPVSEIKHNDDGEEKRYIFQNECEWRYVPSEEQLPQDWQLMLTNEDVTDSARECYSKALENNPKTWLKFEWDDVKYIIVPNENDSKEMIKCIQEQNIANDDKEMLISKIEVSERFLEDV